MNFTPRVPNVTVYYDCATSCCLPPTMTMTPEVCVSSCDGTATATVGAGGVSPYSYQWNDLSAQTTQTAIGLCAGTYSVDVTDNTGCISTNTVTVTSGAASADATITPEGPFCESDAALNLSAVDPVGTWSGTGITDGLTGSFDPSVAGAGTHTITYTIADPCGDIQTTDIVVNPVYNLVDNLNACENTDVIYPDGTTATITASTSYTSNLTTAADCDSIIVTNVTMDPVYIIMEAFDVCLGGNYTYPDGTISTNIAVDESHVSNMLTGLGCDSIITTNITINSTYTSTENISLCQGSDHIYPDGATSTNILVDESHISTFVSLLGCDSLVTTNITINPIYSFVEVVNACENSNITYPDGTTAAIIASTSYTSNFTTATGCDSIIVTNVEMDLIYNLVNDINACENSSVTYPDGITVTITANTSHTSNLTTASGCDSVIVTNITMNPLPNSGNNGAAIFCPTDPPSDLTNQLVGTFDVGGTWSPVFSSGNNFFNPAIDPAGTYTYTVTNSCGTSTTDVIVTITADPNAGTDGNTTVCETDPSVDLFGLLGGTPTTGGVWSPALSSGTGIYNPILDAGGAYTYLITTSCGTFSSFVDVTLNVADDATFSYSSDVYCLNTADPVASISVTNGGVFTISSGGIIDATTGAIDLIGSGPGTFGITYSTAGPCPDVFVLTITILDVIDPTITLVGPFCSYDAPVILQASQPGGIWSGTGVNPVTGEFNPSLAASGLNDITYTINGSCIAFSTAQIEVIPAPIVSTIADTIILNGNSVNLITTGNASAYNWAPGTNLTCDDCQNPIATPDVTATYTVSVEENGCVASDQVTITIDYEIVIYVSNAFTPDGDGKNDVFTPIIADIDPDQYKFLIFNRWGELIFESQHPSQGWDGYHNGVLAPDGAYVWKISCKEVSTIDTHEYMGHVTLIK